MTRWPAAIIASLALAGASAGAWAQYKVVDAQGRVTYTDTPPPRAAASAARVTRLRVAGEAAAADDSAGQALPPALRQVAERYPVVLYTMADCAGCDTGRAQLQRRGIPFDERTVATPDDAAALERLTGGNELPVLRIGEQILRGQTASAWDTYLSAAGYPAQSVLQAGYRPRAPQPLAPPPATTRAAASAPEASTSADAFPTAPPPAPGGITF